MVCACMYTYCIIIWVWNDRCPGVRPVYHGLLLAYVHREKRLRMENFRCFSVPPQLHLHHRSNITMHSASHHQLAQTHSKIRKFKSFTANIAIIERLAPLILQLSHSHHRPRRAPLGDTIPAFSHPSCFSAYPPLLVLDSKMMYTPPLNPSPCPSSSETVHLDSRWPFANETPTVWEPIRQESPAGAKGISDP